MAGGAPESSRRPVPFVLASASPARLVTLQRAGVDPFVLVSSVDEDAALAQATARYGDLSSPEVALLLARAKCEDVATRLQADDLDDREPPDPLGGTLPRVASPEHRSAPARAPGDDGALVLGCDSVLDIDGRVHGKPRDAHEARRRWRSMRGHSGQLHTGHWLIDVRPSDAGGTGATLGAVASTMVWFASLPDEEIDAYVATGEPLHVAGAFTIDGLGGPFIDRIDGDPHNVVGVSLPVVRELLAQLGLSWYDVRRG